MWIWGGSSVPVFECVADQILKHLLQVGFAHVHFGQRVVGHLGLAFPNGFRQAGEGVSEHHRRIHRGSVRSTTPALV